MGRVAAMCHGEMMGWGELGYEAAVSGPHDKARLLEHGHRPLGLDGWNLVPWEYWANDGFQ